MRAEATPRFCPLRFRFHSWTLLLALPGVLGAAGPALGQTCLTQAKMAPTQRTEVGAAAYKLAGAVLAGDSKTVQDATIPQYATNFGQTGYLIRTTSAGMSGNMLAVTQSYVLDASARSANDSSEAEFSCPLVGTAAETDFAIASLPAGQYAFVMVEARGASPWLLSFLLQSTTAGWKMAGFYPHRREAAGHNGLWYWNTARTEAKDGRSWLAWVLYGEADSLLRPANFVSTTNLDRLRTETRTAAPAALSSGLNASTPLALQGPNGTTFAITGLASEASQDGKQLNLVVHLKSEGGGDTNAQTARNLAAGGTLLAAHPELRTGFANLWVIAEAPGANPFVTERPIAEMVSK